MYGGQQACTTRDCFQRLTFETAVRHGATFGMERKREKTYLDPAFH
jgi:hypothetical protein